MDAYEATRVVFSRIQNLDPENASKIMGLLLIQDHGEKEMIRLAFGPEALVHSVIFKARKELGLAGNSPSTPSTPSSPSPFLAGSQISLSRQNSSSSSSRLGGGGISLPSPLSIPNPNSSSAFSDYQSPLNDLISPNSSSFPNNGITNFSSLNSSSPLMNPSSPFYGGTELIDDFQLQDHLSFLNDGSPNLGPKNPEIFYPQQELGSSPNANSGDPMLFPPYGSAAGDWGGSVNGLPHRRSCSVSDICLGSDDSVSGLGWKPCLYFARGFCKNGTSCRFLHGGLTDPAGMVGGSDAAANLVGSPNKLDMMEQCQELLIRSKSAQQQQRLAAMASASFPYSSSKCMNFLLQQQQQNDSQRAATALTMGEDLHKFGRSRLERNHFGMNGALDMNPGSRQIYLTFPADSTFREEDVSNYFSIYGPVQDVRIPYQQKRMFGFVTFVYPETVKIILAKGNPHFVCDARVLVKPYKEKGKVPDKYRKQQQVERGDFSSCNSPTGLDGRDPFDVQLGPRMFYNTQDMLWRRKLEEQADLQQALELQSRRLMSLQLLDVKKHHHHRTLSTGGAPIGSPVHSPNFFNHSGVFPSDRNSPEDPEDKCSSPAIPARATGDQQVQKSVNVTTEKELTGSNENGNESPHDEGSDVQESVDHNLPDSPFASATGDSVSAFAFPAGEAEKPVSAALAYNNNLIAPSLLPATSTLDMASFKSCYFQMPRLSGHGAIGM